MKPKAREKELIVEELPEETLVYDLDRHKAYCLNRTTALVWRHCNGRTTVDQISRILQKELGISSGKDLVHLALDRLERSKLLASEDGPKSDLPNISRRDAIQQLGLGSGLAAFMPMVLQMKAPIAAAAATCITATECMRYSRANAGRCCCGSRLRCATNGQCCGTSC